MEVDAVIRFLRDSGRELVDPALLGLPVTAGKTEWTLERATDRIVRSLVDGEEAVVRQILVDLMLADHSLTAIFDDVLTPALYRVGEQWSCGDVAVYQERRGCEILMRCLHERLGSLPGISSSEPVAFGATIEGDNYTIPVTMAETVLRSIRWRATALGTNLPFDTLYKAIEESRPRMFWLSVSYICDELSFVDGVNEIFSRVHDYGGALAIGGQAVREELRRRIQYSTFCESFRDLERFARSLHPIAGQPTPPRSND